MLIQCSYCQSKVDGRQLGEVEEQEEEGMYRVVLLECPVCNKALVGLQFRCQTEYGWEWDDAARVYPEPEKNSGSYAIPVAVRESLQEARRCFGARAFTAAAVMCGRAIEEMCRAHGTGNVPLAQGLIVLRDQGVIDARLYKWGDSLRQERNIGAHATGVSISGQDARDVLDFATAICEYVYVLSDRYQRYLDRKSKAKPATPATDRQEE